ncbi:MAG TPA: hypothetical protein VIP05_21420 [Burkholderiaceae bacterium]
MFSIAALLLVLAIVAINVRNQLHAARQLAPRAAASSSQAASAPFGGTSSPSVAQFQQELDKQMKAAAERAASAGAEADTTR